MKSSARTGISLVSILVILGLAVLIYHLTRILLASLGMLILLVIVLYFLFRKG